MQDQWAIGGVSRDDADPRGAPPAEGRIAPARLPLSARLLVFAVGLVAVAAIAAAAWVYTETQRDTRRLAAEIAQIKLSLELFGRQQQTAGAAPAAAPAVDTGALEEIENRLAILEESWRQAPAPAAPAVEASGSTSTLAASGDCMPQDTRFLVTAGDNYPVCGTESSVEVTEVGDNDVVFAGSDDPIVVGGSMALPDTSCIVAVLSANADGLSGYGEVRVSC